MHVCRYPFKFVLGRLQVENRSGWGSFFTLYHVVVRRRRFRLQKFYSVKQGVFFDFITCGDPLEAGLY